MLHLLHTDVLHCTQVANLPTPTPRASTPSGSDAEITIEDYATHGGIPMGLDTMPGNADMLFDCIRVTWVFMIIGESCAILSGTPH